MVDDNVLKIAALIAMETRSPPLQYQSSTLENVRCGAAHAKRT